jgi:DNA-binding beta-propeller fold protein YncE
MTTTANRRFARTTRAARAVAVSLHALLAAAIAVDGCASKPKALFTPLPKPIVWPAPPEPARIRYVGAVATSEDLKPAVGLGESIGNTLFGKKASFSMLSPYAVCTDGGDRLFVADSNGQFVHVFDLKSRKYARWVPANVEKRFAMPVGIAWDPAGRLFVADSVAKRIYVFDRGGTQVGEIGAGIFTRPAGLAYDARNGRLFVADAGSHEVYLYDRAGKPVLKMGGRGTGPGRFNFPTNVAVDSRGRLYVSDSLNFRVQQYSPDLRTVRMIGRKGDLPGYFGQPKGLAVDSQDHLYVVDAQFEAVQIFDSNGALLLDFGAEGAGPGEFWLPAGIYIDGHNHVWIADTYNRRVQLFDFLPEGSS